MKVKQFANDDVERGRHPYPAEIQLIAKADDNVSKNSRNKNNGDEG